MEHPRLKISVTLPPELVRAVDRTVRARRGATRSGVIEAWLQRGARLAERDRLEAETIAYYESLSTSERSEDAALARASANAARRLELDED